MTTSQPRSSSRGPVLRLSEPHLWWVAARGGLPAIDDLPRAQWHTTIRYGIVADIVDRFARALGTLDPDQPAESLSLRLDPRVVDALGRKGMTALVRWLGSPGRPESAPDQTVRVDLGWDGFTDGRHRTTFAWRARPDALLPIRSSAFEQGPAGCREGVDLAVGKGAILSRTPAFAAVVARAAHGEDPTPAAFGPLIDLGRFPPRQA